jgi:hypothetical protein
MGSLNVAGFRLPVHLDLRVDNVASSSDSVASSHRHRFDLHDSTIVVKVHKSIDFVCVGLPASLGGPGGRRLGDQLAAVVTGVHGLTSRRRTASVSEAPHWPSLPSMTLNTTAWKGSFHHGHGRLETNQHPFGPNFPIGKVTLSTDMYSYIASHMTVTAIDSTAIKQSLLAIMPTLRYFTIDTSIFKIGLHLGASIVGELLPTSSNIHERAPNRWADIYGLGSSINVNAASAAAELDLVALPADGIIVSVNITSAHTNPNAPLWPTLLRHPKPADPTESKGAVLLEVPTQSSRFDEASTSYISTRTSEESLPRDHPPRNSWHKWASSTWANGAIELSSQLLEPSVMSSLLDASVGLQHNASLCSCLLRVAVIAASRAKSTWT